MKKFYLLFFLFIFSISFGIMKIEKDEYDNVNICFECGEEISYYPDGRIKSYLINGEEYKIDDTLVNIEYLWQLKEEAEKNSNPNPILAYKNLKNYIAAYNLSVNLSLMEKIQLLKLEHSIDTIILQYESLNQNDIILENIQNILKSSEISEERKKEFIKNLLNICKEFEGKTVDL